MDALPVSGISVGRITRLIWSILCKSGLSPPCMVKIFSSMIAAMGRQLKQSVKVFQILMLYRRLPKESSRALCIRGSGLKGCPTGRTFIVEPIYPIGAGAFMVAAKDEEVFWVLDLVRQKKTYCFQRLLPSIDVVAEKQIIAFWREAAVLEQAEEIVILAMNIP